jgi:dephospho-CoA kinase
VIVVEAIKLLEGPLRTACDNIWVTTSPMEVQLRRLRDKRGLSAEVARQRIAAQPPQAEKISAADVVINNEGSFEATWKQVLANWRNTIPEGISEPLQPGAAGEDGLQVERAGPRQAKEIADFITTVSKRRRSMSEADVMAAFGEKAFLLLKADQRIVGLAGWQVENLVARVSEMYLEPGLALGEAVRVLMARIEVASRELQSEALLLFLPPHLGRHVAVWDALGYTARSPQDLKINAWEEAAIESMPVGTVMYFKQLRRDRVLRPV